MTPPAKPKRPATLRARKLRTVLGALAVCGVNGEKTNAAAKLARLLKKYDFDTRDNSEAKLFAGQFYPDCTARRVWLFDTGQMDWAANVKWAIEQGCHVACVLRGPELLAECKPETAGRLAEITATITTGFGRLWEIFRAAPGANPSDRQTFLLGLYDGMMDEHRAGRIAPARPCCDCPYSEGETECACAAGGLLRPSLHRGCGPGQATPFLRAAARDRGRTFQPDKPTTQTMKTPMLNKIESGALALSITALFALAFATACHRQPPAAEAPTAAAGTPVATTPPAGAIAAPQDNPLVLSVPVTGGKMTETFATWADMKQAETQLGLR